MSRNVTSNPFLKKIKSKKVTKNTDKSIEIEPNETPIKNVPFNIIKSGAFDPLSDDSEKTDEDDIKIELSNDCSINEWLKTPVAYRFKEPFHWNKDDFVTFERITPRDVNSTESSLDPTSGSSNVSIVEDEEGVLVKERIESNTLPSSTEKSVKTQRKSNKKRFPNNPELKHDKAMFKYWNQRYDLFNRFDMGIKLDKESWFSVTPEKIAAEQANLCKETDVVLDPFCGAGGNVIQFASKCKKVIALDNDPSKLELLRNNLEVYGTDSTKVQMHCEDFYEFIEQYKYITSTFTENPERRRYDVVYLSPPWGGIEYVREYSDKFDITAAMLPELLVKVRQLNARLIMIYMPRNTIDQDMQQLALDNETFSTHIHYKDRHKKNRKTIKSKTYMYTIE